MSESEPTNLSLFQRGWRVLQWTLAIILGVLSLLMLIPVESHSAPNAPMTGYYASVITVMIVAIGLSPPVFFRLPKVAKWANYAAIFVAFGFFGSMVGQVQAAHELTPEGAMEAAQRDAERSRQKILEEKLRQDEEAVADAKNALAQLEEIQKQQEDCLSWGGELKSLNSIVQESLHNPDSFEHEETRFIVPGPDRYNVEMTFRAENGFGAIRKTRILARMDPAECTILDVTEPIS